MTPLALGAAVAGAAFTAVWVASLRPRDVSLVDRFWGPGFALLAWVYVVACAATGPRAIAVATLASLWGLRLGWHLHLRNRGQLSPESGDFPLHFASEQSGSAAPTRRRAA